MDMQALKDDFLSALGHISHGSHASPTDFHADMPTPTATGPEHESEPTTDTASRGGAPGLAWPAVFDISIDEYINAVNALLCSMASVTVRATTYAWHATTTALGAVDYAGGAVWAADQLDALAEIYHQRNPTWRGLAVQLDAFLAGLDDACWAACLRLASRVGLVLCFWSLQLLQAVLLPRVVWRNAVKPILERSAAVVRGS